MDGMLHETLGSDLTEVDAMAEYAALWGAMLLSQHPGPGSLANAKRRTAEAAQAKASMSVLLRQNADHVSRYNRLVRNHERLRQQSADTSRHQAARILTLEAECEFLRRQLASLCNSSACLQPTNQ